MPNPTLYLNTAAVTPEWLASVLSRPDVPSELAALLPSRNGDALQYGSAKPYVVLSDGARLDQIRSWLGPDVGPVRWGAETNPYGDAARPESTPSGSSSPFHNSPGPYGDDSARPGPKPCAAGEDQKAAALARLLDLYVWSCGIHDESKPDFTSRDFALLLSSR